MFGFTCFCFRFLTQGSGRYSAPSLVEITAPIVGTNIIKTILASKGFRVTFLLQLITFRHKLINILLTNTGCDSVSRSYGRDEPPLIRGKSMLVSLRVMLAQIGTQNLRAQDVRICETQD